MEKYKRSFLKIRPPGFNVNSLANHKAVAQRVFDRAGYRIIDNCPVCNTASASSYCKQFQIGIKQCNRCGVLYCEMFPNDFEDVYSNKEYFGLIRDAYLSDERERVELFGQDRLEFIRSHKSNFLTLLDIGAGTGWFANYARSMGINVEVFEYSKPLIEFLTQSRGLTAVESLDYVGKRYDVLTLYDVIEHHPNPLELIRQSSNLLTDDGIIIIYTPNWRSLGFAYLRDANNLLCPPQHLFYFDLHSLSYLADRLELDVVHHQFNGLDFYDINSYLLDKGLESHFNSEDVLVAAQQVVDAAGLSNHIRCVLRKSHAR